MKYLVTGGLGFVGNEVVRQLLSMNHEVVVIDNGSGVAPNISDIINKIKLFQVDITDFDAVNSVINRELPDAVIHMAAMHFIPLCNQYPLRTHDINVKGSMHILESCSINNISNCTLISSGSIYGDSDEFLDEDKSPCKIFDAYSYSKLAMEDITKLYSLRNPNSQYNVIRLFNVYGFRETNPHIIPEIINQLKQGNTLNLGNITPKRDFIYVKDAAAGIIAINNRVNGSKLDTINLCSGEDFSMEEVINVISTILDKPIRVIANPAKFREQDKLFQKGSVAKLRQVVAFRANYSITKGLKELLKLEGLTA